MALPGLPIERAEPIPVETGGIVDETGRRAECFGASLDQGRERLQLDKIGGKGGRLTALALDLGNKLQGLGGGAAVVDAHAPAPIREIERNDPAEPAPRAGHENGPGILVLSHAVLWGSVRRIESQREFLGA